MSKVQTRVGAAAAARLAYFLKRLSLDLVGIARATKGDVAPTEENYAKYFGDDRHVFVHRQFQERALTRFSDASSGRVSYYTHYARSHITDRRFLYWVLLREGRSWPIVRYLCRRTPRDLNTAFIAGLEGKEERSASRTSSWPYSRANMEKRRRSNSLGNAVVISRWRCRRDEWGGQSLLSILNSHLRKQLCRRSLNDRVELVSIVSSDPSLTP